MFVRGAGTNGLAGLQKNRESALSARALTGMFLEKIKKKLWEGNENDR